MADDNIVGYNPTDPLQQGFLHAIALGETGNSAFASTEGTGGANLAGASTDQYGFPIWSGEGNSHAAGTYQFQPQTWQSIASQYGLNFQNPGDQSEGAWYLAEQVFAQKTGGSLEQALSTGQYQSVQAALGQTWTSVGGNQANPTGLASILGTYISSAGSSIGNAITGGNGAGAAGAGGSSSGSASANSGGSGGGLLASLWGGATNTFVRAGLIVLGIVIIAAALWAILAQQGIVPTPREIVKAV